jgi:hypothetical protein
MLNITNNYKAFAKKELNNLTQELKHDREQRLRKWNQALELMREVDRQREQVHYSY